MKRATYHHRDLPEALLAAADELVAEKGAAGFSLREAARMIGVDPAACYRHFRDREAVLQELARRGFTRLAVRMKERLADVRISKQRPDVELLALGKEYTAFALEHPSSFRVMFGPMGLESRDPRLRGDHPEGEGPYGLLQAAIARWTATTRRKVNREELALMMWSAMHGLASLLMEGALRPPPRTRDRLVESLVLTLLAGAGHARPRGVLKESPRRHPE